MTEHKECNYDRADVTHRDALKNLWTQPDELSRHHASLFRPESNSGGSHCTNHPFKRGFKFGEEEERSDQAWGGAKRGLRGSRKICGKLSSTRRP